MFVFSGETSDRSLGGRSTLRAGANFPKDVDWSRVSGTRVIAHLLAAGTLQACPEDTEDLGGLERDAAKALAQATTDPVRLAQWLAVERRPAVLASLQAQAARYPAPASSSTTAQPERSAAESKAPTPEPSPAPTTAHFERESAPTTAHLEREAAPTTAHPERSAAESKDAAPPADPERSAEDPTAPTAETPAPSANEPKAANPPKPPRAPRAPKTPKAPTE